MAEKGTFLRTSSRISIKGSHFSRSVALLIINAIRGLNKIEEVNFEKKIKEEYDRRNQAKLLLQEALFSKFTMKNANDRTSYKNIARALNKSNIIIIILEIN